ncbi:TPA: hypothetical protein KN074_002715 [Clostridioides difficile]|nr:hypothetical protein [Clostridioides difficile]
MQELEVFNLFWGIILTMWYVKLTTLFILLAAEESIILTKWYVKVGLIIIDIPFAKSIILTMWYVKIVLN